MANIFDAIKKKLESVKLEQNSGQGPYTGDAGSSNSAKNTSSTSGTVAQQNKAYNQVFNSSISDNQMNYSQVAVPKVQQSSYNQPSISNNNFNNKVSQAQIVSEAISNHGNNSIQSALQKTKNSLPESALGNTVASIFSSAADKATGIYGSIKNSIKDMELDRVNKNLEKVKDSNQKLIDSASQDDFNAIVDQNGQLIDFSGTLVQLHNRESMLQTALESNPAAKEELDEIKKEISRYESLDKLKNAVFENGNLEALKDDYSDEANAYREQLSHKNDNGFQRTGSAINHLLLETLNIVPTIMDQAREGGNTSFANEVIQATQERLNNGSITQEEYKKVLQAMNDYIEESRSINSDNLSQKIREISTQVNANTYYGANDVEKFVLQAGESTAQFMLHYVLFKGASVFTMSAASGSAKADQLLSQGVDYETAMKNGFLTGFVSYLTEHIPLESFERVVLNGAGDKIVSHIMESLFVQGINEGLEELIEGLVDPVIDSMTLGTPYEVNGAELLNSFLLGAASGGIGGVIGGAYSSLNIKINSKQQMNSLQTEIDTLNALIPQMDPGFQNQARILIRENQRKIANFKMANPYLNAYSSPRDNVETTSVAEDTNAIYETLTPDFNNEVQENRALDEVQGILKSKVVKTELSELAQYENVLAQRGVTYDNIDFDSLSDAAKINTNITAEYAQATNKNVLFADMRDADGNIIDGIWIDGHIVINPNAERGALSTLIHEYTHGVESSKYYNRLKNLIRRELGSNYQAALDQIKTAYAGIEGVDYEKELVAIRAQDLLSNQQFVNRLVKYNNSLATRIYEDIKNLLSYTDAVDDIEYNFMRAFKDVENTSESSNLEVNPNFSIWKFKDGRKYAKYEDLVIEGDNPALWGQQIEDYIIDNITHGKEVTFLLNDGREVKIDGKTAWKMGDTYGLTEEQTKAKAEAAGVLYDVLEASRASGHLDLYKKRRNDNISSFDYRTSYFEDSKGNYWQLGISIGNDVNGDVVYNIGRLDKRKKPSSGSSLVKRNKGAQINSGLLQNNSSNNNNENQTKEITEKISKLSKGISLEDLGRQKDLLAIHNLSEDKLLKSIDLGGFAVPSIAVTKDSIPHEGYGDISLIFDKSTIDPSRKENYVYGGDAWTGTYPTVEYDISYDELSKAADRVESIIPLKELSKLGNVGALSSASMMDDLLNKHNGDPVESFKKNEALKYVYLVDKGEAFDIPTKVGDIAVNSKLKADEFQKLFDILAQEGVGLNELKSIKESGKLQEFAQSLVPAMTDQINQAYIERYPELNQKRIDKGLEPLALYYEGSVNGDQMPWWEVLDGLNDTLRYWEEGARTVIDTKAFDSLIKDNFDQEGYENWLRDLFADVKIKNGIRNDKDFYTSAGNLRSFNQLHDPYTLENIMKYMKKQAGSDSRGKHEGVFGIGAGDIQATQKIDFKSIAEIIAHENMLQNLSDEEVGTVIKPSMDKIRDVANMIEDIYAGNGGSNDVESSVHRSNNAMEFLKESMKKNTKEQMIRYYQKEFAPYPYLRMTDEQLNSVLDQIINLKDELRNMPTKYFEAKPVRIVGLNEIQTAVIPKNASDALKQRLSELGINTVEYDPSVKGDRTAAVNSLENLKFSKGINLDNLRADARNSLKELSDPSRRVSLKDVLNVAIDDIMQYGQIEPDTYDALRQKVIDSSYAKVPNDSYDVVRGIREIMGSNFLRKDGWDKTLAEINNKYHIYDEESTGINSYIDARDYIRDYIESIGDRYLYMNPVDMGYMTDEEFDHVVNRKLNEVINNLYEAIENNDLNESSIDKILNPEENALIDELVMEDATGNSRSVQETLGQIKYDQETGEIIEDMDRIGRESLDALLNEGNFEEAFNQATAGNYSPELMDRMEEEAVKNITIDQAKKETGEILSNVKKNKPLRSWKDKDVWYQFRQKIFDKGIAIRDIKDSELSAKYDFLLNSENFANYAILNGIYDMNGDKQTDSLVSIAKLIPEEEKNDFDYYMYQKHNIDAAKIGKPVFFNFDAAKSKQIVAQYELLHPEWVNVAQKYYDYNDALLDRQVKSGVITRDVANLWKQMYPHYVPTKRVSDTVDEGNLVETKDPKVTSSNKGTLYERTGGTSPIQPLDYAMAEHTKQVYKSALFNNFAEDYVRATNSKTTLFSDMPGFEDVVSGQESVLTEADENTPATLIWYDKGDRKIVEIPENIYDALGPTQTPFNLPSSVPFVAWATKLRTNMITGANPVFWLTNGIKDFQDIAFNSKYAKDTYLNLPRAYNELLKNGQIARLYKSMGGEYQTYSSEAGINQNDHGKFYNATIGNFVKFNELIEMAPRLAEFMSSLDHGDSIETAMYNAAEVTTNFKRGGDFAKWMNRNGFNFFNASIQGFDKQIRNITDAYDSKGWKGIVSYMAKAAILSGVPLAVLNGLLHKDDDDYDKLSDYIKDNYYILWKYDDGKFVRIPKGRIANAYQEIMTNLYENGVELASDDSAGKKARTIWDNTLESLKNVWEQIGINGLEGNNILSPVFQVLENKAWYGDPIVSSNMAKKDPADQYDESTDLMSIWLGEKLNYSPKKINYLFDQYSGGAGDVILPMLTQKAETGFDDGTLKGKVTSAVLSPIADKFTTDSVFKNQDVTDFFTLDEELTALANKENASDEAILASKYINSIQNQMNQLYAERRRIYNDTSMTDAEKHNKARDVQKQIDELARYGLDTYDQLDIDAYYGNLSGVSYYKSNNGEWAKVDSDREAALNSLGLTTAEKSNFFYTTNEISQIRKDIKADTPEGESADYKKATIDAITSSGLNAKAKNYLYDSYYAGKLTENINGMDVSDDEKLALKIANANATAAYDANGKTISNSKALSVADAYADADLLDDVFAYIRKNGLQPSDMGLTKTVYNYSYNQMASAYKKVFGQSFGSDNTEDVSSTVDSSYYGSSGYPSKRSRAQIKQEAQLKKLKNALMKALKAQAGSGSSNSTASILSNMTSISDAKAKVKKIMQNAYKG